MFDCRNLVGQIVKGASCSYKLIEQIGIGATSKVYKAQIYQEADLGELRAIKIYSSRISVSEEHFLKELISKQPGEFTRLVMHYELFYSLEICRHCLVMELGQGSLSSAMEQYRWNKGPLQKKEQMSFIIYEIARAINDLHQKNFTHRDIKPENVIFMRPLKDNERPSLKLADFGLTKDSKMLATTSIGTMLYSAPEIQNNSQLPYSEKVDVWALGCIWFWLKNAGEDLQLQNFSNQSQSDIDIAVKNLDLDDTLAALLNKTLRLDSSARISIEEFLKEFEKICPQLKQNPRAAPAIKQALAPLVIATLNTPPKLIQIPAPIPISDQILSFSERIRNLEMKVNGIAQAVESIKKEPFLDNIELLVRLNKLEESFQMLGGQNDNPPPKRIEIMPKSILQRQRDQSTSPRIEISSQIEPKSLDIKNLKEEIQNELKKQFGETITEILKLVKDLPNKIENIQTTFKGFLNQYSLDSGGINNQMTQGNRDGSSKYKTH